MKILDIRKLLSLVLFCAASIRTHPTLTHNYLHLLHVYSMRPSRNAVCIIRECRNTMIFPISTKTIMLWCTQKSKSKKWLSVCIPTFTKHRCVAPVNSPGWPPRGVIGAYVGRVGLHTDCCSQVLDCYTHLILVPAQQMEGTARCLSLFVSLYITVHPNKRTTIYNTYPWNALQSLCTEICTETANKAVAPTRCNARNFLQGFLIV